MTEIIEVSLDPEIEKFQTEWAAGAYDREVIAVAESRRNAYILEADPLNFKWQETQLDVDRVAWLEKKDEIKARYPNPTQEVK